MRRRPTPVPAASTLALSRLDTARIEVFRRPLERARGVPEDDLGCRAIGVDDNEGRLGGGLLDPVDDGVLVDVCEDMVGMDEPPFGYVIAIW